MKLTLEQVLGATGGRVLGGTPPGNPVFTGVATDTRTLQPGSLFVALKGPRFDGHDYLATAAAAGAAGVLVHREVSAQGLPAVRVADTLVALGQLGRWVRRTLGPRVLAVTGSVGKTTTKEIAAAVLGALGMPALVTPGNWNNRVGLPLTLLGATGEEQVAVLELGISEVGEMSHLTSICEPDVALITAVAECHTEGLGSLEGVATEKRSVQAGLRAGGALVVPVGEPLLNRPSEKPGCNKITFGWDPRADVVADGWQARGEEGSMFRLDGVPVQLGLPGRHNADNAVAALAGLDALGVPWRDGVGALASLRPSPLRGEVRRVAGDIRLLVDCYNANPRAVEASLEVFAGLAGAARKIAVLGEMRELGRGAEEGHNRVGRAAARAGVEQLHLLGRHTAWVRDAAVAAGVSAGSIWIYDDREALVVSLLRRLRPGDWVLVKGSRALGLEAVVDAVAGHSERAAMG
ncbi:MAG: UDP-N-acetylmuramoyl-tripeptide--D-alanyl-D-alanine ligase [Deferrisomatales bacterium]|nr:UDP-N-acetylmuramoyl-tripeptide--D-alanyl-D-alanine ligase [Deferrisomatales bacterium]